MSCNNSSNINLVKTYITITNGGSRLMINIPDAKCAIGVTNGSVIRYDPTANNSSGLYKLSVANNTASAEVVGIVESINSDNSKNVVIYGSINLPNSAIEDIPAGYSGGSGGSDIYFLSPTSSGKIRNNAPTDLKHIVKPIYQTAPHGNGSYTGVVMNYIGYKIDGTDLSSATQTFIDNQTFAGTENILDFDSNSGIGIVKFMLVDTSLPFTIPNTFVDMTISHLLTITEYPEYFNIFGYFNSINAGAAVTSLVPAARLFVEYCVADISSHTVNSSNIGKYIWRTDQNYYAEIIDFDPANNAYLISHNMLSTSAFVTQTATQAPANVRYKIVNSIGSTTILAQFKFTTVSPYGVFTPKLTFNSSVNDFNGAQKNNFKIIPILKVTNDINAGSASLEANIFSASTLKINNQDVNNILNNFESRLQTIEARLLID